MRRVNNDNSDTSNATRNLITNPELVLDTSDKLMYKNLVTNPSFETAGSPIAVRTNLATNPSFESTSGSITTRTNLAVNPSFETAGAATTVWENLATNPVFQTLGSETTLWTNLSRNPRFQATSGTVEVHRNLCINPDATATTATGTFPQSGGGPAASTISFVTDFGHNGNTSIRKQITSSGQTGIKFPCERIDLKTGQKISISMWVYSTKGGTFTVYADASKTADATYTGMNGGYKVVPANTWTNITGTMTAGFDLYVTSGVGVYGLTADVGDTLWFDECVVTYGPKIESYFDGNNPAEGDFTYAWNGTPGASTSARRGVAVTGAESQRSVAISTTHNGEKGIRVIPVCRRPGSTEYYEGADTFINLRDQVYYGNNTLKPNTTYTMLSTVVLENPLSSGGSAPKFRFNIDSIDQSSSIVSNTVGTYTVRWQFTTGADATTYFMRFMPGPSGSTTHSNEVILKNFVVVEGIYTGPYFDGSTPTKENLVTTAATAMTASTSHTTGVSFVGSTWTRTANAAGGTHLTRQYVDAAKLVLGETYTVSVTLANDQDTSQTVAVDWCDVGSTTYTLAPGEVKRVVVSGSRPATGQYIYGATYRFSDIHLPFDAAQSRSILYKDWLIEKGTTSGEYYTGTGDFSYAWNGTANTSSSVQKATTIKGVTVSRDTGVANSAFFGYRSVDEADRSNNIRWVAPAGTPSSGWRVGGINTAGWDSSKVLAGKTYTLTFRYRSKGWVPNNTWTVQIADGSTSNPVIRGDVSRTVNNWEWQTYRRTFVAEINALASSIIYFGLPISTDSTTDGIFEVADWSLVEGQYVGGTFTGDNPAADDLTYSWSGTAHDSRSLATGVTASGFASTLNSKAIQSTRFAPTGKKSVRVIPTASSNDSFLRVPVTLTNKTYTISATLHQSAPMLDVASHNRARKIAIYHGGSTVFSSTKSNTAGSQRLSVTFTAITDGNAYQEIRLYNGGPGGDVDIWWDDIVVEEGTTSGVYYDGSTPIQQNLCSNPSFTTGISSYSWISASLSRVSGKGDGFVGELTQTIDGSTRQGAVYIHSSPFPADTYTVSFDMAGSAPELTDVRVIPYDTVTTLSRGTVTVPMIKDGSFHRYTVTINATGEFNRVYFEAIGANIPLGTKIWLDRILIERGVTSASPYYEGTGDYTYAWTGASDNSTSTQSAPNVTGWTSVSGYVKTTKDTLVKKHGAASMKVVGYENGNRTTQSTFAATAGKTYAFSADMRHDAAVSRELRLDYTFQDANGVRLGAYNAGPTVMVSGKTWKRISTKSIAAPTNTATITVYAAIIGSTISETLWADAFLIEDSGYIGEYFDGSTPDKLNLATNASLTSDTLGWYSNNSTTMPVARSTVSPISGVASLVSTRADTSPNIAVGSVYLNGTGGLTTLKIIPGETYTASLDMRVTTSNRRATVYIAFRNASGAFLAQSPSTASTLTPNQVSRLATTAIAPEGSDSMILLAEVYTTDGTNAVAGEQVWYDNLLIEKSTTANSFYEGTGDFTYGWSGTANASTSTKTGTRVAGFIGSVSYALRSSEWSSSGNYSCRHISNYALGAGSAYIDVTTHLSSTIVLTPGKTYTAMVKCRLDKVPVNTQGPSLAILMFGAGAHVSMSAPRTVGVHNLRITFTLPETGLTSYYLRLSNNGVTGDVDVWWDDFVITEGAYAGGYFDGDTTDTASETYLWDGTAHASTSSMRGMSLKGSWSSNRATFHGSTIEPFSGSSKLKATVSGVGYFPRVQSMRVRAVPGRNYTAFAKMKCATQPVQIGIEWLKGGVSAGNTPAVTSASNNQWATVKTTAQAPSDADQVHVLLGVPTASPLGTEFEIDSVFLTDSAYNGPFGSGDSYGWAWEGDPNNSTSVGYPVGLRQLAGPPLFVASNIGEYVLTNIDPTKNPVLATNAPRTIYCVVDNTGVELPSSTYNILVYGKDSLDELGVADYNTTLTLRYQRTSSTVTAPTHNLTMTRRTGGAGPTREVSNVGRHVLVSGINENGHLFTAVDKGPWNVDTGAAMSVAHERIRVSNSAYHTHVATYIYPGVHSPAVRQEMVKLLAHEHSIPGM